MLATEQHIHMRVPTHPADHQDSAVTLLQLLFVSAHPPLPCRLIRPFSCVPPYQTSSMSVQVSSSSQHARRS